jgi:uncharacterized protein YaaN involved in tellurite resistance
MRKFVEGKAEALSRLGDSAIVDMLEVLDYGRDVIEKSANSMDKVYVKSNELGYVTTDFKKLRERLDRLVRDAFALARDMDDYYHDAEDYLYDKGVLEDD